jgi:hypothetical protein
MDPIRSESVSELRGAFEEARSAFEDALRLADGRWEERLLSGCVLPSLPTSFKRASFNELPPGTARTWRGVGR